MVEILISFWEGLFSGAMLVSGRVFVEYSNSGLCMFLPFRPIDKCLHIMISELIKSYCIYIYIYILYPHD